MEILPKETCPGKTWIEDGYDCFCEFEEMCMHFMSPCECILEWKYFSRKQHLDLEKLYDMVDEYDNYEKTDDDICNDPEWCEIRKFAKKVYDDFKRVKYVGDGED